MISRRYQQQPGEEPKSKTCYNLCMVDIEIEQRDKLISVLESLEKLTEKQVSLKSNFLRGLIYGLGTVIGATVLISLLSYIVLNLFGVEIFNMNFFQDMQAAVSTSGLE